MFSTYPHKISTALLFLLFVGVLLVPAGRANAAPIYSQTNTSGSEVQVAKRSTPAYVATSTDFLAGGMPVGTEVVYGQFWLRDNTPGSPTSPEGPSLSLMCWMNDFGGGWVPFTGYSTTTPGVAELSDGLYHRYDVSWVINSDSSWANVSLCDPGTNDDLRVQFGWGGKDNGAYTYANSGGLIYLVLTYDPADLPYDFTRIDTVEPYDNEIVATSTPVAVGATGFVHEDDFREGTRVRIKLDRQTDQQAVGALVAWQSAFGNYTTFDVDADGAFDFSTTSVENLNGVEREGVWVMRTVIEIPSFTLLGVNFSYRQAVSTTTEFVFGEKTGVDVVQDAAESVLEDIVAAGDPFANCQFDFSSIIDFSEPDNIITCVLGIASTLIIPNQDQLVALMDAQRNEFLNKPPFGYVYLAGNALMGYDGVEGANIADSNLVLTLPDTGYFASSTADTTLAGETITIIDWESLAEDVDGISDTEAMTQLYDFINLMMSVGFLFWLWRFGTRIMQP